MSVPRAHQSLLVGALLVGALLAAPVTVLIPVPASASLIGELSGTVTGDGVRLPNVWVTLTPVSDSGAVIGDPIRTLTDELGRYEFPQIDDRTIKVHVRAPLVGELVDTFWPDAHTFAQAGVIEISSRPVIADLDLPPGGSVSGRVVDIATGAPVPEAQVSAVIAASPESGPVGFTSRTQASAAFAISGLPPVPMELRVRLPPTSRYLARGPSEWQPGVPINGARTTSGVSVGLLRGAEISGTVRDDTGAPVEGAQIKVVGCLPYCPLITSSDASGSYRIARVTPGSRLGVVAWKDDQLVRQWYPGRDNPSLATDLALDAGDEVDIIDFALSRAAFMTVRVTAADSGASLPGAIVLLVSSTDRFQRHYALRAKDGSGRMRLGPLHAGSYTLSVLPASSNPGYSAVERATSPGIAPRGIIELGPDDDVDVAVALPPVDGWQGPGTDAVVGARTDSAPTGWPGLAVGFLATSGQMPWPW